MTSQVEQFIPFEDPNFYIDDPYPVFARLQREQPVYYYEPLDIFVLTKIDDIREAARQAGIFSSGHGLFLNDLRMQKDNVAEESVFSEVQAGSQPPKIAARYLGPQLTQALESIERLIDRLVAEKLRLHSAPGESLQGVI